MTYSTDQFSPELTVYVLADSGRDYEIAIEKVGGGTIGHAYEGHWHFLVLGSDDILEMFTGTPKTHHEAAEIAADFIDAARDEIEWEDDKPTNLYGYGDSPMGQ